MSQRGSRFELSFMGFVKVALPFALMQVLLATFYLLLLGWLGAVS